MKLLTGARIGVNALGVRDDTGGARTYLMGMLEGMAANLRGQGGPSLVILAGEYNRHLFDPLARHPFVQVITVAGRGASALAVAWRNALVLPRRLRRLDLDLVWNPAELGGLRGGVPVVTTVHGPLTVPSMRSATPAGAKVLGPARRLYFALMLARTLRRSRRVVAISQAVADALAADFPDIAGRITVVKEGAPQPSGRPPPFRARKAQLLFVSTMYPYKGQDVAIRCLAALRRRRPDLEARLVLVGRFLDRRVEVGLRRLAADEGVAGAVECAGGLDAQSLRRRMDESRVLLHPSYAEGFGLTPLEAMAAGVPCIVSNRMATPEVSGPGAVVCDPDDVAAWASAAEHLLTDEAHWRLCQQRGSAWVRRYTWEDCGRALLDVLVAAAKP